LEAFSVVYHNDATAKERNLSAEQRLLLHQAESGPVVEDLQVWLGRQFDERRVEPNSALGGAISYLLRHWEKLALFLRVPGGSPGQQHLRTGIEKSDPSSAKFPVLQTKPAAVPTSGCFYEPDSHLRTLWDQPLRLPHRTRSPLGRSGHEPPQLGAMELPADGRR
jgi:hypothetical protein